MTILKIYKLEDSEEAKPLSTLSEGEHIIGRGFLNCNDKRVSRKHARIIIEKNGVTIKSEHINPCFHKSCLSNSISILPKDKSVTLNNNDQFALLSDIFWFRVKVINEDEYQSNGVTEVLENNINNETLTVGTSFKRNIESSNDSSPLKKQRTSCEAESRSIVPEVEAVSTLPANLENIIVQENEAINTVNDRTHGSNAKEQVSDDDCANEEEKEAPETSNNTVENNQSDESEVKPDLKEIHIISPMTEEKGNALLDKQIKDEPSTSTTIKTEYIEGNEVNTTNEDGRGETIGDNVKKEFDTATDNVNSATDNVNKAAGNGTDTTDNGNNVTDNASHMKTRRDRCWYGQACYRKNLQHRSDFSHPGDDDYDSDPDDDRPNCPFGNDCYRVNLDHRREFKHRGKPAPKPNDPGPSSPGTSTQSTKPKKKRNKKKQQRKTDHSDVSDVESDTSVGSDQNTPPKKKRKAAPTNLKVSETPEDDYDYQDPFINDATDEEFQLSDDDDDDDDDDTDWQDSQEADEESQETRRLLREAKKFAKRKK